MNIHFIEDHVYCERYIEFVNKNFDSKNHLFVIISRNLKKTEHLNTTNNLIIISGKRLKLFKNLFTFLKKHRTDKLIFHYFSSFKIIAALFSSKENIRYWILWGGDFYSQVKYPKFDMETIKIVGNTGEITRNFKGKMENFLFRFAVRFKIDYIAAIPEEFTIVKQYLKTRAKRIDFLFPNPIKKENYEIVQNNSIQKRILLGNSADPTNNHVTILKKLSELDYDFRVYVPLSYSGNEQYIKKIQEEGKELLGEKFIPILEYMTPQDYGNFLNTIDVAIMNHYRQQAVGNIRTLLLMGKKIYLNTFNPVYEYFLHNNIKIYPIDDNMKSKLFEPIEKQEKMENIHYLQNIYSQQNILEYMTKIFYL